MPNARWDTISVDFVVELPKLLGFDIVMIVVNSVFKRAYFILIHIIITVEGTAK